MGHWIVGVTSFQKIYGLYSVEHHKVEKWPDKVGCVWILWVCSIQPLSVLQEWLTAAHRILLLKLAVLGVGGVGGVMTQPKLLVLLPGAVWYCRVPKKKKEELLMEMDNLSAIGFGLAGTTAVTQCKNGGRH